MIDNANMVYLVILREPVLTLVPQASPPPCYGKFPNER